MKEFFEEAINDAVAHGVNIPLAKQMYRIDRNREFFSYWNATSEQEAIDLCAQYYGLSARRKNRLTARIEE